MNDLRLVAIELLRVVWGCHYGRETYQSFVWLGAPHDNSGVFCKRDGRLQNDRAWTRRRSNRGCRRSQGAAPQTFLGPTLAIPYSVPPQFPAESTSKGFISFFPHRPPPPSTLHGRTAPLSFQSAGISGRLESSMRTSTYREFRQRLPKVLSSIGPALRWLLE